MEVKDLSCLSSNKIVYCTMEVDGGDKLQTDQAEASKPWSVSAACLLRFTVFYFIHLYAAMTLNMLHKLKHCVHSCTNISTGQCGISTNIRIHGHKAILHELITLQMHREISVFK